MYLCNDYSSLQRATPISECILSDYNAPYIVRFVDADAEISAMYWIIVEHTPIVECNNISTAIFTAFAFYYIIDINFPPKVQDLLLFVQEKIFGLTTTGQRKAPAYQTFCTSLKLYGLETLSEL